MSGPFANIMSMFASAAQPAAPATPTGVTPAAPATPATPGNIPAVPTIAASGDTSGAAANGVVPAGTNTTDLSKSPLDAFADFWKNDATNTAQAAPLFTATKEQMMEAASKADFRSAIKPEQLQAIAQGGEGAVQAFADAMNVIAQQVYAQSAFASTKLIESAVQKNNQHILTNELPTHIKRHAVGDSLRTNNEALNHPAVQPIAEALKQQLVVKFPNATTAELNQMASNYITGLAQAFAPAPAANTAANTGKPADTDWNTFLS